jgi:hypothetical protein
VHYAFSSEVTYTNSSTVLAAKPSSRKQGTTIFSAHFRQQLYPMFQMCFSLVVFVSTRTELTQGIIPLQKKIAIPFRTQGIHKIIFNLSIA